VKNPNDYRCEKADNDDPGNQANETRKYAVKYFVPYSFGVLVAEAKQ
jgi:hypothetical protein